MNFEEFRSFIEGRMQTEWTQTPIEFENVSESTALITAKDAKSPWVRVTIREGNGQLMTIGSDSRRDRYAGNIIIQIFIAQKIGTKTARDLADDIVSLWRGYTAQPCVQIWTPFITTVGDLNGWFQINVNIPFLNDEIN